MFDVYFEAEVLRCNHRALRVKFCSVETEGEFYGEVSGTHKGNSTHFDVSRPRNADPNRYRAKLFLELAAVLAGGSYIEATWSESLLQAGLQDLKKLQARRQPHGELTPPKEE